MKQKGLAPIYLLIVLIILVVILLTPIPYYFSYSCDIPCISPSSCYCPTPGWKLGDPLWNKIINYFYDANRPVNSGDAITVTPLPSPLSSSNPESSNSAETANWKTYTNERGRYQYSYPNDWQYMPPTDSAEAYAKKPTTQFPEGSFLVDYNLNKDTIICDEEGLSDLKNKDFITNKSRINIAGEPAIQLEGKYRGQYPKYVHDYKKVLVKHNSYCYRLSLGIGDNDEEITILNQILSTFKFLP